MAHACARCGQALTVLRHPVRRLRWTRYWWRGFTSLFTGPLSVCPQCGAIYSNQGTLIAAGVVQTEAEQQVDLYRKDMAYVRDSFAGVIIASELVVVWLIAGPGAASLAQIVAAAAVGAVSFLPYAYFGRKVRAARRDLKRLSQARRSSAVDESEG